MDTERLAACKGRRGWGGVEGARWFKVQKISSWSSRPSNMEIKIKGIKGQEEPGKGVLNKEIELVSRNSPKRSGHGRFAYCSENLIQALNVARRAQMHKT